MTHFLRRKKVFNKKIDVKKLRKQKHQWSIDYGFKQNFIRMATDFIQETAEELGYENSGKLAQLLDEVDSLAMQKLDDEEKMNTKQNRFKYLLDEYQNKVNRFDTLFRNYIAEENSTGKRFRVQLNTEQQYYSIYNEVDQPKTSFTTWTVDLDEFLRRFTIIEVKS